MGAGPTAVADEIASKIHELGFAFADHIYDVPAEDMVEALQFHGLIKDADVPSLTELMSDESDAFDDEVASLLLTWEPSGPKPLGEIGDLTEEEIVESVMKTMKEMVDDEGLAFGVDAEMDADILTALVGLDVPEAFHELNPGELNFEGKAKDAMVKWWFAHGDTDLLAGETEVSVPKGVAKFKALENLGFGSGVSVSDVEGSDLVEVMLVHDAITVGNAEHLISLGYGSPAFDDTVEEMLVHWYNDAGFSVSPHVIPGLNGHTEKEILDIASEEFGIELDGEAPRTVIYKFLKKKDDGGLGVDVFLKNPDGTLKTGVMFEGSLQNLVTHWYVTEQPGTKDFVPNSGEIMEFASEHFGMNFFEEHPDKVYEKLLAVGVDTHTLIAPSGHLKEGKSFEIALQNTLTDWAFEEADKIHHGATTKEFATKFKKHFVGSALWHKAKGTLT
jgi:hypothetical protein